MNATVRLTKVFNLNATISKAFVPKSCTLINFEEAIVNVGGGIFETRPAKMAYVCAFMEFICEIAKKMKIFHWMI